MAWGLAIVASPSSVLGRNQLGTSPTFFELPAQKLSDALEVFVRLANREILYDGHLTEGRRSAEVGGVYTPETALEIILAGTGLEADAKEDGFFVLRRPVSQSSDRRPDQIIDDRHYYALIQAALRQTFCHAPSPQRVAARLWIGRGGEVLQVRALGMVDGGRQRVEAALRGMKVGGPPPDFAQPVTIVVEAGGPEPAADCMASAHAAKAGRP